MASRRLTALERVLVGLEVFLAASACLGAVGLITGGIDLGAAASDLPLASPVLGGLALGLVNGIFPTVVAVAALSHSPSARYGHLAVGLVLSVWIMVQVAFIGPVSWLQAGYLGYGLLVTGLALLLLYRTRHHGAPNGAAADRNN